MQVQEGHPSQLAVAVAVSRGFNVQARPTVAVSQAADITVGREFSLGVEPVEVLAVRLRQGTARKNMEHQAQVSLHP
jgi:hypothetical protein